jgi:tetratricopeptide (TPR) repeat protein
MKGLILTHMGKREEGLELVKKGVRLDLTSHIVWHVFGLIQKGEKNYEEALKSYTQALRFDKVGFACGPAFPGCRFSQQLARTTRQRFASLCWSYAIVYIFFAYVCPAG